MGFKIKLFLLVSTIVVNSVDLISDWLLYHDVAHAEAGLVFGPFDIKLVTALLVVSSIGSVILLTEAIVMALDVWRENFPPIAQDIMTFIAIWFEEVPQMVINCIIVACREEAVSVFQVSKASMCMVGVLFRFFVTIIRYCCLKRKDDGTDRQLRGCVTIRGITIPGLVIALVLSGIVFGFSNFSFDNTAWKFHHPRNLFDGEYKNKAKYLGDVGLFVNFETNGSQGGLPMMASDQWIKLSKVEDIGPGASGLMVKIQYARINNMDQVLALHSSRFDNFLVGRNKTLECYSRDIIGTVKSVTDSTCIGLLNNTNAITSLLMRFDFIENNDHLLMGDLRYNFLTMENDECKGLQSKILSFHSLGEIHHNLGYLKLQPNADKIHHLSVSNNYSAKFFSFKEDNVKAVSEVWKTGFFKCDTTGRPYPKLDTHLDVPCK